MQPRDGVALLLMLLVALAITMLAVPTVGAAPLAQATATPEPTATPSYTTEVQLSSGRLMVVERRWSLGEVATFIAVLTLVVLEVASIVTGYATRWTR